MTRRGGPLEHLEIDDDFVPLDRPPAVQAAEIDGGLETPADSSGAHGSFQTSPFGTDKVIEFIEPEGAIVEIENLIDQVVFVEHQAFQVGLEHLLFVGLDLDPLPEVLVALPGDLISWGPG